jgi:hypothetical protein
MQASFSTIDRVGGTATRDLLSGGGTLIYNSELG